uniref:Uncharacterized protein n=2 Tax=Clastoptera arizonana TaxID=38151 RepID=A0A1B6E817_9HEMI
MDILKFIDKTWPCREKQLKEIYNLLGDGTENVPSSIFVYGQSATGKSSIVTHLLSLIGARYAIANCIECYSPRLLFEPLLAELIGDAGSEILEERCDSFMMFVNYLKIAAHKDIFEENHCVIVLDECEHLMELGEHYLIAFSRLQELTAIKNLCVIFISQLLPEKFIYDLSYFNIPFPQYNKDELLEILMLDCPKEYSTQFYKTYLNLFLSVFLRATRDLNEMRYLSEINFKKYCEPIEDGSVKEDDVSALWKKISPHLKASLYNVYLGTNVSETRYFSNVSGSKNLISLDLPYYTKYFLIAAFLASYNAPREDKRLFVKHQVKKKKRLVQNKKKENTANDLLGPKTFTLDRLLAIFYAIMEEKANLTANLTAQISTLVELRLLTKLGDTLDKPKYKCAVGFEFVESVSKTLGFNVRKYMIR